MKQPCVWKPNPNSSLVHNVVNEITGKVLGHVWHSKTQIKNGQRYFQAISYTVRTSSGEYMGASVGEVFDTPEKAMDYIAETSIVK